MSIYGVGGNEYAQYYYQGYGQKTEKEQSGNEANYDMAGFFAENDNFNVGIADSDEECANEEVKNSVANGVMPYRMPMIYEPSEEEMKLGAAFLHYPENLSYKMKAEMSGEFSEDSPIVKVSLNKNGKMTEYNINLKEINPDNASEIEMYALARYMEANGMKISDKISVWDFLKICRDEGFSKGNIAKYTKEIEENGLENVKTNWNDLIKNVRDEINRIKEKLENGDTEKSFSIGGSSFTLKEWNKMLDKFDRIQEEMREQMRKDNAYKMKGDKTNANYNNNDESDS